VHLGALGLVLALLSQPLAAEAQRAAMAQIGLLRFGSPPDPFVEAFRQGLRDLGYVEGRNIAVQIRWAEGNRDRLSALAAELVQLKVDVIVTAQRAPAMALRQATGMIPVVIAAAADPVGAGLVDSLARPGRNITGSTLMAPELDSKRVQLLKEAHPRTSRIAMLFEAGARSGRPAALRRAAEQLGAAFQTIELQHPYDFEHAFNAMKKDRIDGLLVPAFFMPNRKERENIVELAARHRIPTLYDTKEFVEAGGLMSYGPSVSDAWRRAATYVDRILKGAKPAELPMEQPSKFELVINLKTAKVLGITVPPSLLLRAEQVIE
jgi:putative ABC transport system substrate-binding protein